MGSCRGSAWCCSCSKYSQCSWDPQSQSHSSLVCHWWWCPSLDFWVFSRTNSHCLRRLSLACNQWNISLQMGSLCTTLWPDWDSIGEMCETCIWESVVGQSIGWTDSHWSPSWRDTRPKGRSRTHCLLGMWTWDVATAQGNFWESRTDQTTQHLLPGWMIPLPIWVSPWSSIPSQG